MAVRTDLKIPHGIADFRRIRNAGFYSADKTEYLTGWRTGIPLYSSFARSPLPVSVVPLAEVASVGGGLAQAEERLTPLGMRRSAGRPFAGTVPEQPDRRREDNEKGRKRR